MIELVTIGSELLSGQTVNTNASFIGKLLLCEGYEVSQTTILSDRAGPLLRGLEAAMERASFIITTGGLGPTSDDPTRKTLAELFQTKLVFDEHVASDLKKRFGGKLETLEDQATVLKDSEVLLNPVGTAPGFILRKGSKILVALPGVPAQMEEMMSAYVIPLLKKEVKSHRFQHALFFCLLSEQAVDPYLRQLEEIHPDVEIGICPSYGALSVYLSAKASSHEEAKVKLSPVVSAIREKFNPYLFSERIGQIEYAVHEAFTREMKTLACAESCTGGKIASRLTQISGASDYFLGSIVSYSNELKRSALKVSSETLQMHGAVSREAVIEMVQGTFDLVSADYVIAVSGIAGPTGGTDRKPIGTVWGAIGERGKEIYAAKFLAKGAPRRDIIIDYSATYLLSSLWQLIHHGITPFGEI